MSPLPTPRRRTGVRLAFTSLAVVAAVAIAGCGGDSSDESSTGSSDTLTVYSGREEEMVAPLYKQFEDQSGIKLDIRYGNTPELAAQIGEEGDNSPADVFVAQDAGSLGSIADQFAPLPQESLDRVNAQFRDTEGRWVGLSGRVRVVSFNNTKYSADELPDTVLEYAKPEYASKMGVAPTNGSFVAFVSAMRLQLGDDTTKTFLADLKKNGVKTFDGNRVIVEAINNGDVDFGLVNHYYLAVVKASTPDVKVDNKYMKAGDPGGLVNVTGAAILKSSENSENAQKFVEFLLSDEGQTFYATEEHTEYPLATGVAAAEGLPPLESQIGGDVKLGDLAEKAQSTADMIAESGLGE